MILISDDIKSDPKKRWELTDDVFFAAGACHILADAFLRRYPSRGFTAKWIRPDSGFRGNHIFVTNERVAFDYRGYTPWKSYCQEVERSMLATFPFWTYDLVDINQDALISNEKSLQMGISLREPYQFLFDALPRAEAYLNKFRPPFE